MLARVTTQKQQPSPAALFWHSNYNFPNKELSGWLRFSQEEIWPNVTVSMGHQSDGALSRLLVAAAKTINWQTLRNQIRKWLDILSTKFIIFYGHQFTFWMRQKWFETGWWKKCQTIANFLLVSIPFRWWCRRRGRRHLNHRIASDGRCVDWMERIELWIEVTYDGICENDNDNGAMS